MQGAYTPAYTYTMSDLNAITTYAHDRGVRLVMEVDVPGHAASMNIYIITHISIITHIYIHIY